MRLTLLLLMGGILLLSACGEEDSDPTFSFSRTLTPDARSNGDVDSILNFEPALGVRYALVAGDGRACAYGERTGFKGEGYLSCWGRKINPKDKNQVGHNVRGEIKVLSVGSDHVCTTLTTGDRRVHCDGSNSHGQNTDPEPLDVQDVKRGHWLSSPNVVASGDNHNCAIDVYGIYCWGNNSKGQIDVPVLSAPRWVAAGGDTSCAVDDNNGTDELICWGNNNHGQVDVPAGLTAISKIAVGHDYVCVANVGQVECWGNTADWTIPTYTNVVHISAGKDHVCVLDETQASPQELSAGCFGNENAEGDLLDVPASINNNIRTISAGNGFTCASNTYSGFAWSTDSDGVFQPEEHKGILCWGKNDENQASAPNQLCLGYHSQAIEFDDRTCQ